MQGRAPSLAPSASLGLRRRSGHRQLQRQLKGNMTTLSPENSLSARQSATFILEKRKPPIDKTEWDSFFDENGHLAKSRDFICVNILERGLHPFVRTEAWKFLTGYYSWQSSRDERLMVDSNRRRNYKALCQMYEKIQPLLENLHGNFTETRNNIAYDIQRLYDKDPLGNVLVDKKKLEKTLLLSYVCNTKAEYQRGFHEMVMLFQLMVGHEHETFWLFQFFLQKTEHSCVINIGVGKNLDMLNSVITLLDPEFAEHLSEWSTVTTTSHTSRREGLRSCAVSLPLVLPLLPACLQILRRCLEALGGLADGEALQEFPGAGGLQHATDGA
ncbi:TBC1 domain family member 21 isoform X2 [Peromyscus eremicus]|uniref:TBC1 domain family member 21 isoform X2 n=1 Tax=Peromyscus eremicus TaxID=42410 RepID=UPI0027DE6198|nr:TBC1 domain family member 21 isoform X2 [Peromyscus eremicus]